MTEEVAVGPAFLTQDFYLIFSPALLSEGFEVYVGFQGLGLSYRDCLGMVYLAHLCCGERVPSMATRYKGWRDTLLQKKNQSVRRILCRSLLM